MVIKIKDLYSWFLYLYFVASLVLFACSPLRFDKAFLLITGLAGAGAYAITAWYLSRVKSTVFSWFGLLNLFCLGFAIVHFQAPIFAFFFENLATNRKLWFRPECSSVAASASLCGFISFLIAYHKFRERLIDKPRNKAAAYIAPSKLTGASYVFCGCAVVSYTVFYFFAGVNYRSGAYAGVEGYWGPYATYLFLTFNVFYHCTIIFDLYRLRLQYERLSPLEFIMKCNVSVLALVFFFIFMCLYVGDRGPILSTGFIYIGAYSVFFSRIRFVTFACLAMSGLVIMFFIGKYRTSETNISLETKIEKGRKAFEDAEWHEVTMELAGSFRCVCASVKVTEGGDYFWGIFKLANFTSIIPFSSTIVVPLFKDNGALTLSSRYLTAVIISPTSHIGVGTTVIADIYLDFGVVGTIVLMAILGGFFAWLEVGSQKSLDFFIFSSFVLFLSIGFYWGRAHFFPNQKLIVWSLLLLKFVHMSFASNKHVFCQYQKGKEHNRILSVL